MAEGLAKRAFGPEHAVYSAGLHPTERSPLALRALQEIGIDITHQTAKPLSDVPWAEMDWVVVLLAQAPALPAGTKICHLPTPDPSLETGSEQGRMECFRDTRDALEIRIASFVAESRGALPCGPH